MIDWKIIFIGVCQKIKRSIETRLIGCKKIFYEKILKFVSKGIEICMKIVRF